MSEINMGPLSAESHHDINDGAPDLLILEQGSGTPV
jgi:hypothetical protein